MATEVTDRCIPGSTGENEILSSSASSEEIERSSGVVWSTSDVTTGVPQVLQKRALPCKSVLQFVQRICDYPRIFDVVSPQGLFMRINQYSGTSYRDVW